jgi:uncharacterized membrane protein
MRYQNIKIMVEGICILGVMDFIGGSLFLTITLALWNIAEAYQELELGRVSPENTILVSRENLAVFGEHMAEHLNPW